VSKHRRSTRSMRITFVLPNIDLSGGVKVVADYAKGLQARGHDVLVVTRPHAEPPLWEKLKAVIKGRPVPRKYQSATHFDAGGVRVHVLSDSRPVRDDDLPDADVVVATWWETAEWVWRLKASKGVKAYLIQGDETLWAPEDPCWVRRVSETWRLEMHRIVVSDWISERMAARVGKLAMDVILNGVDVEHFSAPARGKNAEPTVGLVFAPGRFKGMDIALKAFYIARRELGNLRLVAFGSSLASEELRLPEDAQFRQQPPQYEIPSLYASCDAWLFASRAEGFGLPVLEAMACGTPVIATPTGAAPLLLATGGGMLVPHENPAAMAAAIVSVCRLSHDEWKVMSQLAVDEARRHPFAAALDQCEASLGRAMGDTDQVVPRTQEVVQGMPEISQAAPAESLIA
jgi:glycosyltransferase involved in cell wall biosynthesis